ncbi:MAG: hypothetical protein AABW86_05030 [Candidatus Micrarchaeota archaeon]
MTNALARKSIDSGMNARFRERSLTDRLQIKPASIAAKQRNEARERAREVKRLVSDANSLERRRRSAAIQRLSTMVNELTNQEALEIVALNARDRTTRVDVVGMIRDRFRLVTIATSSLDDNVKEAASKRIQIMERRRPTEFDGFDALGSIKYGGAVGEI